jgi:hypothetical protein
MGAMNLSCWLITSNVFDGKLEWQIFLFQKSLGSLWSKGEHHDIYFGIYAYILNLLTNGGLV